MEEFMQNKRELPNILEGCSREDYKFTNTYFFSLLGSLPYSILLHPSSDMCHTRYVPNWLRSGCAFPLLSFPTHQLTGKDYKDMEKDRDNTR